MSGVPVSLQRLNEGRSKAFTTCTENMRNEKIVHRLGTFYTKINIPFNLMLPWTFQSPLLGKKPTNPPASPNHLLYFPSPTTQILHPCFVCFHFFCIRSSFLGHLVRNSERQLFHQIPDLIVFVLSGGLLAGCPFTVNTPHLQKNHSEWQVYNFSTPLPAPELGWLKDPTAAHQRTCVYILSDVTYTWRCCHQFRLHYKAQDSL